MQRNRAFTLPDMLAAIAVCVLLSIMAHGMIGCDGGGAGKDSKAAIEDLRKATDELRSASSQLKKSVEDLAAHTEEFEPFAEQVRGELEAAKEKADRGKAKADHEAKLKNDPSYRATARRMQNSTHVRGIHAGMVLFAQGNKDFYPGLDSNGKIATIPIRGSAGIYGTESTDGTQVVYRLAVLLRGNYFSPEYIKSPAETNAAIVAPTATVAGQMKDGRHYSYALLNIADLMLPRVGEWRATNNSRAPVVTDRNIGGGATGTTAQSIHTKPGEGWKGSVAWNDNHASFETSDVMKTEYALKGEVARDQLFSDAEKSDGGTLNADAAMVFKADNKYVNQQP